MSESDGGPGQREVAYRLFAAEFEDADLDYSESDEERAPNYVVTPTGARVNRLFVVGVLTEVEPVSDDVLRARVVDPTGAFVLYAGQYQQDERAFLAQAEPPTFVAVTGKARTFQPDDSDRVFTSVRPESISEVDTDTRDRWTVDAASQTVDRVEAMATALALEATGDVLRTELESRGVEEGLADGIALAIEHYGTTPTYLAAVRDLAVDAARLVADEIEEVAGLDAAPDETGDVTPADLLAEPVEPLESDEDAAEGPAEEDDRSPDAGEVAETATADASGDADSAVAMGSEPETASPAATTSPGDEAGETTQSAAGTADAEETEPAEESGGPGDFEPGEFALDEDEREEIEAEYGTEFQSGTEVDEPGEADIETPEPDDAAADASAPEPAEPTDDTPAASAEEDAPGDVDETDEPASDADEPATGTDEGAVADGEPEAGPDEPAEDVDLVDAVVSAMEDLDEGDGADRTAVVEAVTDRTGAEPDAVEDAIQDALMDGRCYEPGDDRLKPI